MQVGDKDYGLAMAIRSLGRGAAAAALNKPGNAVQGGRVSQGAARAEETQLALTDVIQEAVRRAGIDADDGFTKTDVIAINQQIRKDPTLLEALAQIRGDARRRTGKSGDTADVTAATDRKRRRRRSKDAGSEDEVGEADAAEDDLIVQTDFRVDAVSGAKGRDLTSRMLAVLDADGDGIIAVREMLQFLIFHEEYKFNRIELVNMLRTLNEGLLESFKPRFDAALHDIRSNAQAAIAPATAGRTAAA